MNPLRWLANLARWRPQGVRAPVPARQAGVRVTPDTANTFSAVNACIRINSETLAAMPWPTYRRLATGREAVPSHPVNWLLNFQANPEMTAFVFKRLLLSHYFAWGNGYAEIERGMDGRAIWLWPLLPDRTCVDRSETGALIVRVWTEQGEFILPRENVYHLSDGSYDGLMGLSRIELARRAIAVGMASDVFAASFYANGAAIGGVITNKGRTLSPGAKDELLADFNTKFAGPGRAAKTLYIDGGHEYQKVDIPLADAQFLETRRFQVEEISRWYGTPLHLLNDLTNANYAVSYEASKNFVEHTLRPLACLMEQEANIRLFGARAQGAMYTRMNLNGLMRADPKTRGEYYRSMIGDGTLSLNEVRELEEFNSMGPDGDEHFMQGAMVPVSRVVRGQTTATAPGAQPSEPSTPAADPAAPREENVIRREALAWWRNQQRSANG